MRMLSASVVFFGGLATASLAFGQLAISTHSGLIQYTGGSVFLNDQEIHKTTTTLLEIKKTGVLRTGADGNAEVLLTPGVFLRLAPDTSIRMDSNSLTDTRVSLLSGTAMVECDELVDGNAVAFTLGSNTVEFRKNGLFRLEANPPAVATIKGEAFVSGNVNMTVKHGKLLQLDSSVPQLSKLHLNKKDDLYQFSEARSADSAYATGVTSNSLFSSGYTCGGSSWYLMSSVGMYSYLPCSGAFASPFGYYFLGMNNGYMWNGPAYYAPPIGVFAPVRGSTGGGGAVASSKAPYVPATPGARPGTASAGNSPPIRVPVYVGPAFRNRAPTILYNGNAAGFGGHGRNTAAAGASFPGATPRVNSAAAVRGMAGPSVGNRAMTGESRGGFAAPSGGWAGNAGNSGNWNRGGGQAGSPGGARSNGGGYSSGAATRMSAPSGGGASGGMRGGAAPAPSGNRGK